MSATLATLEQQCENLLGDLTHAYFSQTQIHDWINRAIEDLSIHFPMAAIYTISTTADTHVYDLENSMKGIRSVEYPTGETPPRYLKRKSYTDPSFWLLEGNYDLVKPQTSDSSNPPQLYISDHTPATETITCWVECDHTALSQSADETTILDRHVHLIGLFVRWKAYQERAAHDMEDPSPLSNRFASMEIAAQRAETAYRDALTRAINAEAESGQASWKMDYHDRIY